MTKLSLIGALAAAVTFGLASSAGAVVVPVSTMSFQFKGQCGDCTGYGVGTLTVQGYTPGTALDSSNLVDFTYSSNLMPVFDINPTNDFLSVDSLSGNISTAQGFYDIHVSSSLFGLFGGDYFDSSTDGTWDAGNSFFFPFSDQDHGTNGLWNPAGVPEPASWALMIAGLGLMGGMLRFGRRSAALAMS